MHQLFYQPFIFRGLVLVLWCFLFLDGCPILRILSNSITQELWEIFVLCLNVWGLRQGLSTIRVRNVGITSIGRVTLEILKQLQILSVHL